MAKIGSLPDWYKNESFKKYEDSSTSTPYLITKFTSIIENLNTENESLRRKISEQDQIINSLTLEVDPMKKNLLLKISLLCEKLKLNSIKDYEAWIDEIEICRIRARVNEETLLNLEGSLKNYREKISELENQLSQFGVDLHQGKSVKFDLKNYLQKTHQICKALNSKLNLSEGTIEIMEELAEMQPQTLEKLQKERVKNNQYRQIYVTSVQETCEFIENNFEDILNNINLLEKHEKVKQEILLKISKSHLLEIEKNSNQNLNESLKLANFLVGLKKAPQSYSDQINSIISSKFIAAKEKSCLKKIFFSQNSQELITSLIKKLLITSSNEKNNFDIQDLTGLIQQLLSASEKTIHSLFENNKSLDLEVNSFHQRKEQIFANGSNNLNSVINQMLECCNLLISHEHFKLKVLNSQESLGEQRKIEKNMIKIKLEEETSVLNGFVELAGEQMAVPESNLFMSMSEFLKVDKKRLEIYEQCLAKIPKIKTLSGFVNSIVSILTEFSVTIEKYCEVLKPGDLGLKNIAANLRSEMHFLEPIWNPQLNQHLLERNCEISEKTLKNFYQIFEELLPQIPNPIPSRSYLENIRDHLKSSNLTIEVLASRYGKQDQYKKLVETNEIPEVELGLDRDFESKWKFMHYYIKRASDLGLNHEIIKREIIEGDIDESKITENFKALTKNLWQTEKNIAELIQTLPVEEFSKNNQKIAKMSKNRATKLRNIYENQSPSVMNAAIKDLAEMQEDLNQALGDIVKNICEKSKIEYEESEELPNLKHIEVIDKQKLNELNSLLDQSKRNNEIIEEIAKKIGIIQEVISNSQKNSSNDEPSLGNILQEAINSEILLKEVEKRLNEGEKNIEIEEKIEELNKNHRDLYKISKNSHQKLKGQNKSQYIVPSENLGKKIEDINKNLQNLIEIENENQEKIEEMQQDLNFESPAKKKGIESQNKLKSRQSKFLSADENKELEKIYESGGNVEGTLLNNLDLLTDKLEKYNQHSENLQKELEGKNKTISDLEKLRDQQNKIVKDYEKALKDSEEKNKLVEEQGKIKKELEEKNIIIKNLEKLVKELEEKSNELKNLEISHKESEKIKDKALENLEKELEARNREIERLNKIQKDLDKNLEQVSDDKAKEIAEKGKETENLSKELLQKSEAIKDLESLRSSLQSSLESASSQLAFYQSNMQLIGKKVSEILVKTDFVGDTLIDLLPDSSLKSKMDLYQDQFEEIIENLGKDQENLPNEIIDLLKLMDKYEDANGIQSSRLSGNPSKFAEEDLSKLSDASKVKPSMAHKKALRSARPSPTPPIELLKDNMKKIDKSIQEIVQNFDPSLTQSIKAKIKEDPEKKKNEEFEYYEEITETLEIITTQINTKLTIWRMLERERESVLKNELDVFNLSDENKKETQNLIETFEKSRIDSTDTVSSSIDKIKEKLVFEKLFSSVKIEKFEEYNSQKVSVDIEKIARDTIKESLNTLSLYQPSDSEMNSFKDKTRTILIAGKPHEIIERLMQIFETLKEIEMAKQNFILNSDLSQTLAEFLKSYQISIKKNTENFQNLFKIVVNLIGSASDKNSLKGIAFNLPQKTSETIPSLLSNLKETSEIFEKFIDQITSKIGQFSGKDEEILNETGDIEERLDEILRNKLKDIGNPESELLKKQVSNAREDFEEFSNSIYETISNKLGHLSQTLSLVKYLETIQKKINENSQKILKKLESDVITKTSECENLQNKFENEEKTWKNKLELAQGSLKEVKTQFEKASKEKIDKDLENTALKNSNSDLAIKVEDLNNEISRLNEEISDQKSAIRNNRNNLREKNEEISKLEEKIREIESTALKPVIGEASISNLQQEISRLNERLGANQKELDQKIDELNACKRDYEISLRENAKTEENFKEVKEELSKVKAKLLASESELRERDERIKLGNQ